MAKTPALSCDGEDVRGVLAEDFRPEVPWWRAWALTLGFGLGEILGLLRKLRP